MFKEYIMSVQPSPSYENSTLPTLEECLQASTWRHLQILARQHNLPCSNRLKKADFIKSLQKKLGNAQNIPHIIAQLRPTAQEALRALLIADGPLPLHRFEEKFGNIRQYRHRQQDERPSKPWLTPTPTEELLYLGLIYRSPAKADQAQTNNHIHSQILLPQQLQSPLAAHLLGSNISPTIQLLPRPGYPADIVVHVGIWLATIAQSPIRLQHQRWLPPRVLGQLIGRIGLDTPLPCRSERQSPYLSFLHQLVTLAGFVEHGQHLQVTPAAWLWMSQPYPKRYQSLWNAYMPKQQDNGAEEFNNMHSALNGFGWKRLSYSGIGLLREMLQEMTVNEQLPLTEWVQQLRLRDRWGSLPTSDLLDWRVTDEKVLGTENLSPLPLDSSAQDESEQESWEQDELANLCYGPLFWFGVFNIAAANPKKMAKFRQRSIRLTSVGAWLLNLPNGNQPETLDPQPCFIRQRNPNHLVATPLTPPNVIARVAPYCIWEKSVDPTTGEQNLQLSAQKIAQAVALQVSTEEILQDINYALALAPNSPMISRRLQQRIRKWAKEGQRVRIQTQTIVQTESAQLMADLRRKKLIRNRLGPPISPNRAIINPNEIPALIQTLSTLNIYTANPFDGQPDTSPSLSKGEVKKGLPCATQWMLLQLYRALGQHIDLPAKIPWEVQKELESQLSATERMSAAETARTIATQIESSLNGYLRIPSWKMPIPMKSDNHSSIPNPKSPTPNPHSPTTIKRIIQQTIATSQPIRIHYWSANQDQPLQRTLTPYYIEERNHIQYLIAYCHLRQEERTFRIDRISQAVQP